MITSSDYIIKRFENSSAQYAVVQNPSYIFPPEEYYLLADPNPRVRKLKAVMMDMDGTTTTTEELCIYSLEKMIRRMSGLFHEDQWTGLDQKADYPNIIGNSTTRHVEFLITKYAHLLNPEHTAREYFHALYRTLMEGYDEKRKQEVIQSAIKLNIKELADNIKNPISIDEALKKYGKVFSNLDFSMQVSIGIDIYYDVYHAILGRIKKGETKQVKKEVFDNQASMHELIAPMPGIEMFIPLLKGWLGEDARYLAGPLIEHYIQAKGQTLSQNRINECIKLLTLLGQNFEKQPVKLGLVTSSIFYEADIVIREIYRIIRERILKSPLPENRKNMIAERYLDYHQVYDAFVTASDSSEIRLKPHRDLYSIALHQAGVLPSEFASVIGLEDSQSGTVAIRAAGIGCCVALPFTGTENHNFEAAVHTLKGGLPQLILEQQLCMNL